MEATISGEEIVMGMRMVKGTTIILVFSGLSNIAFAKHHSVTSWILGCSLALVAAILFPEEERD